MFEPVGRQNFGNASGKVSSQYLTLCHRWLQSDLRRKTIGWNQLTVLLRPAAAGGQTKSALISSENSLASSFQSHVIGLNWSSSVYPSSFTKLCLLTKLQKWDLSKEMDESLCQKFGQLTDFWWADVTLERELTWIHCSWFALYFDLFISL